MRLTTRRWLRISAGMMGATCLAALILRADGEWQAGEAPLRTRWAAAVTPATAHPEYPRPTLVRERLQNLNGLWEYAILPRNLAEATNYSGRICVPFPVESALSGVQRRLNEGDHLWYRRSFTVPAAWQGQRVLLHFEAVDWEATVWVNGREQGQHRGGYDRFTFDITDALRSGAEQEVVVRVFDPTDQGTQPRGKQVSRPQRIWYTPCSGIWQTVWLEPVPPVSLERLEIVPEVDAGRLRIRGRLRGEGADYELRVVARDADGQPAGAASGKATAALDFHLAQPRLWSPASPHLYTLEVELRRDGRVVDRVSSYAGLRKIEVRPDAQGVPRLWLNNEVLFHLGPLDQGYWPEGIYTAPTDAALKHDLEITRALGFNLVRKHVKVEPERWYHWADQLGVLVWQDMPSGDRMIRRDQPDLKRDAESAAQHERELRRLIEGRGQHPCIVVWIPFNEGWGQYDTARIAAWVKALDASRLVLAASGWVDRGGGDLVAEHNYGLPQAPVREALRAGVLGEFGGVALRVTNHLWQSQGAWGHSGCKTAAELATKYENLVEHLRTLKGSAGLAGAVLTQLTDVETEVNGLLTYDRAVLKLDTHWLRQVNERLVLKPGLRPVPLVPTAEAGPVEWRYTFAEPPVGWEKAGFDDSQWAVGPAGFGEPSTPGGPARTAWQGDNIWLRKRFDAPQGTRLANPLFRLQHNDSATVYLNGVRVARFGGWTDRYVVMPFERDYWHLLQASNNVVAVQCLKRLGTPFIDLGLLDYVEAK